MKNLFLKEKIQIIAKGGLGNQLFQLSLAEYLNKIFKNKKKIQINTSWYSSQSKRVFDIKKYYKFDFRTTNSKLTLSDRILSYRSEKLHSLLLKKKYVFFQKYNGYWQDEFYARHLNIENFDKNLFFKKKYLPSKYYIMHFRGDDFFSSKSHIVLEVEYYIKTLKFFLDYPIIAIGDKIHANDILKKINNNKIKYLDLNEYDSFSSIINSNGGIASNSTFCWWGIYINLIKNSNNKFLFPEVWMKNINYSSSKVRILNSKSI